MKWITIIEYVTVHGEVVEDYTEAKYKIIRRRKKVLEGIETTKIHIVRTVIKREYEQLKMKI